MECKNCQDAEKCGRKLELAIAGVTGWKCSHEFSLENVIEHLNTLMDRRVLSDEWTDMIGRAVELLKSKPDIDKIVKELDDTSKQYEPRPFESINWVLRYEGIRIGLEIAQYVVKGEPIPDKFYSHSSQKSNRL